MLTASPLLVVSIGEIASGYAIGPQLDCHGIPRAPIHFVDLAGTPSDAEIDAAADAAATALAVTVGVAGDHTDERLRPLVDALSLTIAPEGGVELGPAAVAVPEVATAAKRLTEAVRGAPQAAIVVAQVLRQSADLGVRAGLAAEASAYSMLLAGSEFARWLDKRGPARSAAAGGAPVAVSRQGNTLNIGLQRPKRRNAMDRTLREGLVEALAVAVADDSLQVVLTGAGPDFCSGGDLDEFGTATDLVAAYLVRLERHPGWLLHHVRDRATVRLHGACIGAGVEIPAFAGRLVAEPSAYFSLPEVAMGLIPGAGGTVSIPRRIGRWRAAWLALSGARIDAATAAEWGLVDEVAGS
jgi:hypothetical protein